VNWISVYPLPYGLLVAMVTGLLGASFFMMIQLQQRISEGTLADARDMWTTPLLVLRCIVGIGAATILYFFFKSGLLQGSIWPDLKGLGFELIATDEANTAFKISKDPKIIPAQDFALLIVWSFIAGYSQTLVPNLLLQTEGRAGAEKT
jgi:hypothetical protein